MRRHFIAHLLAPGFKCLSQYKTWTSMLNLLSCYWKLSFIMDSETVTATNVCLC